METHRNFKKQLAASRQHEDLACEAALADFNEEASEPYNLTRRQDSTNYKTFLSDAEISNGENAIKLEVKTDFRSRDTGNFFIEYCQYGKPSGIAITDADYYIINDTVDYNLISFAKINRIIKRYDEVGKLRRVEFKNSDGLISKGYVFKKAVLVRFATAL